LQAIGDGGQGWGNLVLYIVASDKIRNRLFTCRKEQKSEVNQPILSGHNMDDPSSNIRGYGTAVNNCEVSDSPTTT